MKKINGNIADFMGKGFHQLPPTIVETRPPKIKWGKKYLAMLSADKIVYLQRLASTMNHAAFLISIERDALNKLLHQKEKQLRTLSGNVQQNNAMLQSEVTRMNEERQSFQSTIAKQNAIIRGLKTTSGPSH